MSELRDLHSSAQENSGSNGAEGDRDVSLSQVASSSTGSNEQRSSGWCGAIGRATLRKRVLHDIATADNEAGATKVFNRISERIRNNPRGSGVMAAALHLDGEHSHVHIVHDCNWNSTSCKDVFLQGIAIKKRQSRYNRWSHELTDEYWRDLLLYLYSRGSR